MQMIAITTYENGAHDNQTYHGVLPEGWAIIPDELETENFPFGEVTVEEIDGVPTVVGWTPGIMPEPEPIPEPEEPVDVYDEMAAAIKEGVNEV